MARRSFRARLNLAWRCLATCAFAAEVKAEVELEPVVVQAKRSGYSESASLPPTPLFELPLSVTVLEKSEFIDRQPNDIADLADYSAGVSRRSNYWGANTPTFQLRGFSTGDSSAYYKDGFRYQSKGPMAMANIEAVEILRGPQSALYGWSDPGGIVQVRVKQPTTNTVRALTTQVDSWGKNTTSLDLGGGFGGSGSYRFVAAQAQGGSFRSGQSGQQSFIAPSFAWDLPEGRRLGISLEWLDDRRRTDYGIPAINGAPANVPVDRSYSEAWGRQHTQSTRLSSRWQQPAWGGELTLALSHYELKYLEYRDAEPYSVNGTQISRWYEDYPEHYRWLTSYADWAREIATPGLSHRLSTRIEVARESRSLYRGVLDEFPGIDVYSPARGQSWTPTADYAVYDQAWNNRSIGLAVQDEIRHGNWLILAGVRLGYIRQSFDYADYLPTPGAQNTVQTDRSVTPRMGVSWHFMPAASAFANYATGSMPNLPQNRSFDSRSFTPLSGRQIESGIKLQPGNADWLASATVFDIERNNVLTRDPDHPGYSIQTGVQRSQGVELEYQGKMAERWRLRAQATWLNAFIAQDNRYTVGNRLPYAPKFGASFWLTHHFRQQQEDGRWQISGGLVHQGERYADFANTTQIPAYTRFDTGATYREKNWSATLSIENLLNCRYYASGVENRPSVIYPGAPRTVLLRINAQI